MPLSIIHQVIFITLPSFLTDVCSYFMGWAAFINWHWLTGYLHSDLICKKPVSASIIQANSNNDDSILTPFPNIYRQVKDFLKKHLAIELKGGYRDFLNQMGELQAAGQLQKQLLAYAKGEWPFNAVLHSNNVLGWCIRESWSRCLVGKLFKYCNWFINEILLSS